jgi:hypothetical protein
MPDALTGIRENEGCIRLKLPLFGNLSIIIIVTFVSVEDGFRESNGRTCTDGS